MKKTLMVIVCIAVLMQSNAVGDFAYDRWGENKFTRRLIGPVYPGEELLNFTGNYEAECYDVPCFEVYLYKIDVEYNDGTEETIYYEYSGWEENSELAV